MRKKTPAARARRYALCVEAGEYENVDLVPRKVYEVCPDHAAERLGQIRVIDESGEDYLFPAEYFRLLTLPAGVAPLFRRARSTTESRSRRAASRTHR